MKIKILFGIFGAVFSKKQKCVVCGKNIGYYVSDLNINDNMVFCDEHEIDYTAKKEGWTEYRNRYKSVQKKYLNIKNNNGR